MTISVALCTYNGEQYLQAQLESIAGQTRLPDELVVCDDRSTDRTLSILTRFSEAAPFPVRVHQNEQKLGSTANFQEAIALCRGEMIALADQDDVWYPNKLKCLESALLTKSAAAVFSDADIVDAQLKPTGRMLWQSVRFNQREQQMVAEGRAFAVLLKHNVVTGATLAFRSEFKESLLPIPDVWVHDGWIALVLSILAGITLVDRPLVMYRQHEANQIGVASGLRERLATRHVHLDWLHTQVQRYTVTEARIMELPELPNRKRISEDLRAKVHHTERRAVPLDRKAKRMAVLVEELVRRGYHQYSTGFYSFAKDLTVTFLADRS